jgi:hypothetical protein
MTLGFFDGFLIGGALVVLLHLGIVLFVDWRIKRNGGAITVAPGRNHRPYVPSKGHSGYAPHEPDYRGGLESPEGVKCVVCGVAPEHHF